MACTALTCVLNSRCMKLMHQLTHQLTHQLGTLNTHATEGLSAQAAEPPGLSSPPGVCADFESDPKLFEKVRGSARTL
jgi:hypothetical protein